jgi:AcrR family transcriptional regulator
MASVAKAAASNAVAVRRRRADARRNIDAILGAGRVLLGERPDASMEEVAAVAGVTRQTVYAHFDSREALIHALQDVAAAEALAAIDAAGLAGRPPADALVQFLDVGRQFIQRYPLLLEPVLATPAARDPHEPVKKPLQDLISRGQASGEFDRGLTPAWLAAAILGMSHVASEEVRAGRMTLDAAAAALCESALRICTARTLATGALPREDANATERSSPARPAAKRRRVPGDRRRAATATARVPKPPV